MFTVHITIRDGDVESSREFTFSTRPDAMKFLDECYKAGYVLCPMHLPENREAVPWSVVSNVRIEEVV